MARREYRVTVTRDGSEPVVATWTKLAEAASFRNEWIRWLANFGYRRVYSTPFTYEFRHGQRRAAIAIAAYTTGG